MSALLVTPNNYIDPQARGGVQQCTHDYVRTLIAAGAEPQIASFDIDRALLTRVGRRLWPRPFAYEVPRAFQASVVERCRRLKITTVFLNNSVSSTLAPALRQALSDDVRVVLLSHGAEHTDLVNALRTDPDSVPRHMRAPQWLGQMILQEVEQRRALDLVLCISEEDVLVEKWLGARACLYLPRTVEVAPISWRPQAERLGYVATLDHGPNVDGLSQLASALTGVEDVVLRVVGGPVEAGDRLQREFRNIRYLGRLSDDALRAEASTWSAFTNPMFCQARGASMKVATALGWGVPVATTVEGARGYRWDDALLPRARNRQDLARLCVEISRGDKAEWGRRAVAVRSLSPTCAESGRLVADALTALPGRDRWQESSGQPRDTKE